MSKITSGIINNTSNFLLQGDASIHEDEHLALHVRGRAILHVEDGLPVWSDPGGSRVRAMGHPSHTDARRSHLWAAERCHGTNAVVRNH